MIMYIRKSPQHFGKGFRYILSSRKDFNIIRSLFFAHGSAKTLEQAIGTKIPDEDANSVFKFNVSFKSLGKINDD